MRLCRQKSLLHLSRSVATTEINVEMIHLCTSQVAVETFGPLNRQSLALLSETGSWLSSFNYYRWYSRNMLPVPDRVCQRWSLQRFNAVTFQGTMSILSETKQRLWSRDRINDQIQEQWVLRRGGLDPSDPANYRPIANVTFLSKILERIIVIC